MTFEGVQLQGAAKIMEKLNVSFWLNNVLLYPVSCLHNKDHFMVTNHESIKRIQITIEIIGWSHNKADLEKYGTY